MTTDTAKRIGGRRALVNHIIALMLWEIGLMVYTWIEDPHVGLTLLFFVQVNAIAVVCLLILLSAIYLSGRTAGTEILNNSDGYLKTGIKYALLSSLVIIIPFLAIYYFAGGSNILLPVLLITGTMIVVWLTTARQISRRIASEMEN